jgi:uncharacterized membrane protein
MAEPSSSSDEIIAQRIGILLRVGVIASAAVILLGGAIHLYNHGGDPAVDRSTFRPMPPEFSQPAAILHAALLGRAGEGRGRALIQLGLLLLIATPVMRVAASILAFARQGDVLYVLFPLIVLIVLLYGLFSGQIH